MMSKQVKVWDPLVRIFHWSLVLFFIVAYLSEDQVSIHVLAGYVVLGLIVFRVIWGFIGPEYAKFSQFVSGPRQVLGYIKGIVTMSPKHYLGHNPLGGWMVLMLLAILFVVTLSGLKLYAVEEGLGPFASKSNVQFITTAYADGHDDDDDDDDHKHKKNGDKNDTDEEFWEDIHEGASEFMIFLILLHIAGVLASSMLHDEKLVKAMITGKKTLKNDHEKE